MFWWKKKSQSAPSQSLPSTPSPSPFHSVEHFTSNLTTLYYKLCPRPLYEELLHTLLNTCSTIYSEEFPPHIPSTISRDMRRKLDNFPAAYSLCLETFAEALLQFTAASPDIFLSHSSSSIFSQTYNLNTLSLLLTMPPRSLHSLEDPFSYQVEQAYQQLAKPFKRNSAALEALGVFDWDKCSYPSYYNPLPNPGPFVIDTAHENSLDGLNRATAGLYGGDDPDKTFRLYTRKTQDREKELKDLKRDWERKTKEYAKAEHTVREAAFEKMTKLDHILLHSPFFNHQTELVPHGNITLPFPIPTERWYEGAWIIAPPGRGKTNLARHLFFNLPEDATVIIIDAKGELIQSFSHLKALHDRLVFLEPDLEHPLAINPLDIGGHSVELLEYLFSTLLEAQMTPLQSTLFRSVLILLTQIPDATLTTFRDIILNGYKKYQQHLSKLDPEDAEFFTHEFDTQRYTKTKEEILWRLRLLSGNPHLRAMFKATKTKVDMTELFDSRKVVLINNNYDLLGDQGSEFFGRFFLALIWNAIRKRSRSTATKRPVYVIIDEAQYVIARDRKIATILHQCRAQNISMIFAHQELQQIKDEDVKSALANCSIKFANAEGDAHELAARMDTTPELLTSQPTGSFVARVRGVTQTPVAIAVKLVDMSQYPTISAAQFATLQAQMRLRYCQSLTAPADDTLYWEITVSPIVARDGGERTIQGLRIKIPPYTKHGTKLRLRGVGTPKGGGAKGDIILTVHVAGYEHPFELPHDPTEIG
jgi:hypothetical protein